ncbi:MAG: radical SAM protein [Candidatus Margulisiibacteriota bacterium]
MPNFNVLSDVMRNPRRMLNHSGLLRTKIEIGKRLDIFTMPGTVPSASTMKNLDRLHLLKIGQAEALDTLSFLASRASPALSQKEAISLMVTAYSCGLVELHLTDRCNCRCPGCYYGNFKSDVFPFDGLDHVGEMQPKAITLVGGGEPTVYRSDEKTLADAMTRLSGLSPGVQFGLITNGVALPPQEEQVLGQLTWTRLSIDASTQGTYERIKGAGRHSLDATLNNLRSYLDSPIPYVGAGFLFSSLNISEAVDFLKLIYGIVIEKPGRIDKTNVQYRAMRPSTQDFEAISAGTAFFEYAITEDQLAAAKEQYSELMSNSSPSFREFAETNSNFGSVLKGNTTYTGADFDFCAFPLLYRLVRPSGLIYPCFVSIDLDRQENIMGNILTDDDYRITVGLLSYLYASKIISYCSKDGCRLSRNCHIADDAVRTGNFERPEGPARESYFF